MLIGTTLGPYQIEAKLGEGGMGEVYKAHDTRLERDVALKVLPADLLADDTARARLVREARLASKLNHPHICTIFEVGEAQGRTFIAMELVEGRPLSARLEEGPLPVEHVERYGRQLADALAHAHDRGVVHRDLKSANIVVTPEGQVKVLDFGLAKQVMGEAPDATTMAPPSLTAPGVVAGTPAYMAPEQLRGQPADARSDIWALGVVLYESAAGERPFQGKTGFELSSAILKDTPSPLPPSVPPPLAGVIDRCLRKESGERYQRASDVREALDAVASGEAATRWSTWRVILWRHRRLLLGWAAGAAALVVVAAALLGFDVAGLRSRLAAALGLSGRVIMMAVLPFGNPSGDPAQESLSEGLTSEMIAQLGRLHPAALRVKARTSVMRYRQTDKPIDQIARELGGVDYILEGRVQREGDQVRITAELIKVADQAQLWADSFQRELASILVLQSDVARRVASTLALRLLPAEQARLANVRTVNPEAYDAYLKGSQYWPKLTKADLDTAEQYFELALRKDPDYAAALGGMAIVWACRRQIGVTPPKEAGANAKVAALKAVALDEADASAHFALADVMTWTDLDWAGAEREWKRTVELDPGNPDVLATYSHFLMITGRREAALAQIERALELDPLGPLIQSFYAMDLVMARRFDDAIVQARKTLSMQADAPIAKQALNSALVAKQVYSEALELDRQNARDQEIKDALDRGYAEGGYPGSRRALAEAQAARFRPGRGGATAIARNYIAAGDNDRAIEWLEKGYEAREPQMPYMCFPVYDSIRSDPRFQALLRRMGLPQ